MIGQLCVTDGYPVAVLQGVRLGDLDAIDPGAVGAIQIGQDKEAPFAMKPSMVP